MWTNPNFVMVFSWKWCVFQEYLFKNILRRCLVFGVTSLYYFLCLLFVSERKVNFKATSSKRNRFVPTFLSREWVMGKQKFPGCNLISTIWKEEFTVEFCIVNTFRFYISLINYQLCFLSPTSFCAENVISNIWMYINIFEFNTMLETLGKSPQTWRLKSFIWQYFCDLISTFSGVCIYVYYICMYVCMYVSMYVFMLVGKCVATQVIVGCGRSKKGGGN